MSNVQCLVLFWSILFAFPSSRFVAVAQTTITKYVQLNMCSEELRAPNSTASPRGYAIFPLGKCILYKNGNYQLWNDVPSLSSETANYVFTRGIYSNSDCTTPTEGGEQSLNIPRSCEVVIIPGNLDPYPNILYSAQVLGNIPSPPNSGWTDLYYDESGCNAMIGYTYMRLDTCQFDSNGYIIDYEKLGIPVSDFKVTDCGTLWYYNSADNTCVPTEIIKSQKMLPKRFSECHKDIDNPFVFTVSNGINVRTECSLPGVPPLVCFSGQETVRMESGETKLLRNVKIGDRIQIANFIYSENNHFNVVKNMSIRTGYSNVIAIPHEKNDFKALFHEISTKRGHTIRVTADHVLPIYQASSSSLSASLAPSFVNTLAKDVSIGYFLAIEGGEVDVVIGNRIITSYGLYSVVTEDLGSYILVSGIAASPFAVSHYSLVWFYFLLYRSGFLSMSDYKHHWAYKTIENVTGFLYLFLITSS